MPRHIPSFRRWLMIVLLGCGFVATTASASFAQQKVLLQGNDKLAIVNADGKIEWEMPWGGVHDIQVLANGHIMVQQGAAKISEIDPQTKQVVWSYDSAKQNGNAGKPVEVHAFQPLPDGQVMIAESGPGRIIEINREGQILKEFKLKVLHSHPHTDTRLARKLESGHYLVCHEGDGVVREYDAAGKVVWEYEVPLFGKEPKGGHGPEAFGNKCFAAIRLANGNTLVATGNGHSVLEVTPKKEIVWKVEQRDLPGITLAWVTTLEVLPNGHYLVGNCHAGPGQPLLIEIDPQTKNVVWQLNEFEKFGNNVSNSRVVNIVGQSPPFEMSFGPPGCLLRQPANVSPLEICDQMHSLTLRDSICCGDSHPATANALCSRSEQRLSRKVSSTL